MCLLAACTSGGSGADPGGGDEGDSAERTSTTVAGRTPVELGGRIVVDRSGAEVVVVDVDSGDETVLSGPAEGVVRQPVWSRDASLVAWSSLAPDGTASIRWADPTTGDGGVAATDAAAFYLAFDPRGTEIAWLGNQGGSVALSVVELAGEQDRLLDDAVPYYADWLPSGDLVAHVAGREVRVVAADEIRPLIAGTPVMQAPEVAADGTILVIVDDGEPGGGAGLVDVVTDEDPPRLVRLDVDGEVIDEITEVPDAPVAFDLDPTGARVAIWERAAEGPVLVVDIETGATETVGDDGTLAAAWSPDGTRLALLAGNGDGTGRWRFWDGQDLVDGPAFRPTATFIRDYAPFWDQYLRTATPWAPDSSRLVHTAVVDGEATVVIQPTDGDAARAVGPGEMAWWAPLGQLDRRSAP